MRESLSSFKFYNLIAERISSLSSSQSFVDSFRANTSHKIFFQKHFYITQGTNAVFLIAFSTVNELFKSPVT